jgi:hypothetical protein
VTTVSAFTPVILDDPTSVRLARSGRDVCDVTVVIAGLMSNSNTGTVSDAVAVLAIAASVELEIWSDERGDPVEVVTDVLRVAVAASDEFLAVDDPTVVSADETDCAPSEMGRRPPIAESAVARIVWSSAIDCSADVGALLDAVTMDDTSVDVMFSELWLIGALDRDEVAESVAMLSDDAERILPPAAVTLGLPNETLVAVASITEPVDWVNETASLESVNSADVVVLAVVAVALLESMPVPRLDSSSILVVASDIAPASCSTCRSIDSSVCAEDCEILATSVICSAESVAVVLESVTLARSTDSMTAGTVRDVPCAVLSITFSLTTRALDAWIAVATDVEMLTTSLELVISVDWVALAVATVVLLESIPRPRLDWSSTSTAAVDSVLSSISIWTSIDSSVCAEDCEILATSVICSAESVAAALESVILALSTDSMTAGTVRDVPCAVLSVAFSLTTRALDARIVVATDVEILTTSLEFVNSSAERADATDWLDVAPSSAIERESPLSVVVADVETVAEICITSVSSDWIVFEDAVATLAASATLSSDSSVSVLDRARMPSVVASTDSVLDRIVDDETDMLAVVVDNPVSDESLTALLDEVLAPSDEDSALLSAPSEDDRDVLLLTASLVETDSTDW